MRKAAKAREKAAWDKAAEWKAWARATVEEGGAAAHKFAKDKVQWEDPLVNGIPVVGGQAVAAILGDWAPLWDKASQATPRVCCTAPVGKHVLPRPTLEQFDEACEGFKVTRSCGVDNLNPKWWKFLAPATKERVIDVILRFEDFRQLPLEWLTSIVFLSKPDGGHRPIGLEVAIVSLWGKLRRVQAKEWERSRETHAFWGASAG